MSIFTEARREQMRLRMALTGPAGAGKTYTGMTIARALSPDGRFAVIDTERRALEYADRFKFGHVAPAVADPEALPSMLAAAGNDGYGAVLVDSFSLYWSGSGGALDRVDRKADKRAGWSEYRPIENAVKAAILGYPGHVIVTMRVKTEHVTEVNERGKTITRRLGTKIDQRDTVDYEFSVIGEMDTDHTLTITKTTCADLVDRVIERPGLDLVDTLAAWLGKGDPMPTVLDYRDRAVDLKATFDELRALHTEVKRRNLLDVLVVDNVGDTVPLGELVVRLGRERQPMKLATAALEASEDPA